MPMLNKTDSDICCGTAVKKINVSLLIPDCQPVLVTRSSSVFTVSPVELINENMNCSNILGKVCLSFCVTAVATYQHEAFPSCAIFKDQRELVMLVCCGWIWLLNSWDELKRWEAGLIANHQSFTSLMHSSLFENKSLKLTSNILWNSSPEVWGTLVTSYSFQLYSRDKFRSPKEVLCHNIHSDVHRSDFIIFSQCCHVKSSHWPLMLYRNIKEHTKTAILSVWFLHDYSNTFLSGCRQRRRLS